MQITAVNWFELYAPMAQAVFNSQGGIKAKRALLVQLVGEDGRHGWGEAWSNFPAWGSRDRVLFLKEEIAPQLLGKNVLDRLTWQKELARRYILLGLQYGGPGVISQVLSAVDIALWDLEGKLRAKPLYQLLGQGAAEKIKAYASGIDQADLSNKLQELQAGGYHGFKIRAGFGRENDLSALAQARGTLGDAQTLMIDVNQGWTREEARYMTEALAEFQPAWIEEPLAADDIEGLREIGARLKTPLAAGENLYGAAAFAELCSAVPIIQPDVSKQGGITGLLELQRLARKRGCFLIPHNFCAAVGLAATLHYITAQKDKLLLELDVSPNPLMLQLAAGFPRLRQGCIEVPEGPGLGIEIDTQVLSKYLI